MTPLSFGQDYYKKMLELQEKLRKSEEERIRLEERFKLLEQESRMRHETCINKLRMRYIEFLEEQRVRDERNHKLLNSLDRIDDSLTLMNAKSDRLCTLKKEYDASLMQLCANRRQTASVTGDSGVVSQNEDRQTRKYHRNLSYDNSRPRYDIERKLYNSPKSLGISGNSPNFISSSRPFINQASSLNLTRKSLTNYGGTIVKDEQIQNVNRPQNNQLPSCESKNQAWTDEYMTKQLDSLLKRDVRKNVFIKELSSSQYPNYLTNTTNASKLTSILDTVVNSKEQHVGNVIEGELERYIHKIRSLHDNNDPHSFDEIEQNTSGDLLNVTLSDDGLDHLPVEEKIREREIPTEVETILAMADDFVSKTADDIDVKDDTNDIVPCQSVEEIITDVNVSQKLLCEPAVGNQVALINATINNTNVQPIMSAPICASVEKMKINDDAAIHMTELNSPSESIMITKPIAIDDFYHSKSAQLHSDHVNVPDELPNSDNNYDQTEIVDSRDTYANQQPIDDNKNFETINEIESLNTENFEIQDEKILTNNNSNISDELLHYKTDDPSYNVNETNLTDKNNDDIAVDNNGINNNVETIGDNSKISDENVEINIENNSIANDNVIEGNYESPNEQQYEQSYQQDPQMYSQDPNQMYEYNDEQYQQYQYDPNLQYEQDPTGQYQYDQQNSQYIEAPNGQYHDQQYIDNDNQQYAINPDGQYHKYQTDPNQQYVQDPNGVYDANAIYSYPNEDKNYVAEDPYEKSQGFISNQQHEEYHEQLDNCAIQPDSNNETTANHQNEDISDKLNDNDMNEQHIEPNNEEKTSMNDHTMKKSKDMIKYILDSDTESTIEKNASNTESDFDFN